MNLNGLIRRLQSANKAKLSLFSKLMLDTTLNFFIAIVVFIVASYLLLPRLIHQEKKLQELHQEIEALNEALRAVQRADGQSSAGSSAVDPADDGGPADGLAPDLAPPTAAADAP